MLHRLQLLRNVGQFDSVQAGGRWSLLRNVLVYAENGRGKTTLTAILRRCAVGTLYQSLNVEGFLQQMLPTS